MALRKLERLIPPHRLGERVCLLGKLGEGGMASVYLASLGSGVLSRLGAVKLLRGDLPDHEYRTRFLDEAKIVVQLHHNNLVDVREADEVNGQLYIAMELIEGRDMADLWDQCVVKRRAFPVSLTVYSAREILRGLHYAHTRPGLGLVHRDVSPSNVLIDWAGAVRLADFGLATSTLKVSLTQPGQIFGKLGYMSPEQAKRQPLDGRADVYSVGVMLWEHLTGRPLRSTENLGVQDLVEFTAESPCTYSKRVDPHLERIVMKALSRNPDERWPSAMAMMEELSQWLAAHAPGYGQESVAAFMQELYGPVAEEEHAAFEELMHEGRAHLAKQQPIRVGVPSSPSASDSRPAMETMMVVTPSRTGDPATYESPTHTPPTTSGHLVHKTLGETWDDEDKSESSSGPTSAHPPAPSSTPSSYPPAISASPSSMDLTEDIPAGTIIGDRYQVVTKIGEGGMGTVYMGEHLRVGRKVAIKVLSRQCSQNQRVVSRFRAEAKAASLAEHPNIIEVFDAGDLPDGRLYLVMEFVVGRNLYQESLAVGGRIEWNRAAQIIREVARAIRAAHGAKVIHRDLKPENIMVINSEEVRRDDQVRIKVLDFGIATSLERGTNPRLTQIGQPLGTPSYMAPEQSDGGEPNPRLDIYAMGVIFYEMLAGEAPFEAEGMSFLELMNRKKFEDAPSILEKCPDLPKGAAKLIHSCLDKDPRKRPIDVDAFIKQLDEVTGWDAHALPGSTISATIEKTSSPTPKKNQRSWIPVAIGGGLCAALTAVLWMNFNGPKSSQADEGAFKAATPIAAPSIKEANQDNDPSDLNPGKTNTTQPPTPQATITKTQAPDTEPKPEKASPTTAEADVNQALPSPNNTEEQLEPPELTEAECKKRVKTARRLANQYKWTQLLKVLDPKSCWTNQSERTKLKIEALKETGRFKQCARLGRNHRNNQVRVTAEFCRRRLER